MGEGGGGGRRGSESLEVALVTVGGECGAVVGCMGGREEKEEKGGSEE